MKYEIPPQQRCIHQGGQEIHYTLIRKQVKNMNLRVKTGKQVVVSAAPPVPEDVIDDFVRRNIPFIQKVCGKMAQMDNVQPQFVSGETVKYLGFPLPLLVGRADIRQVPDWIAQAQDGRITDFSRNRQGEAVFRQDGKLFLYAADTEDTASKQQLYDAWQKIQAGILCGRVSRQFYPYFQTLGIAYPEIRIRKMSSRWGSCIPKKQKITYNSLLIEQPLECVEYVVVHEFSHFVYPDHSKAFYDFVGQILPDWKGRRKRML